jgi:hypothetical protein
MEKSQMELFIPSLLAILIAAGIVMFILPRLSPIILGILALVFLVLAAYSHYTFFGSEYQLSTWQLPLVNYAPYILIGGLVLFLIFFIVNFIGTGSTEAAAPIQKMNEAINRVANQIPAAANNAMKAVGLGGIVGAQAANTSANTNTGFNPPPRPNNRGQEIPGYKNLRFSQI